ncbi:hypothetical protein WOLCODRAFT_91164 [Wolfiporia cocos MD-104 SS10]|uniref:DNA 3'-5' helicase n=1 Tax=Wolfiporia cocos (strain MD-104) TaxID=742152 RepID=A0A2H3IXU5_WOLCO|nr:hypothetical protein WOLCODRAFT_91164 [Wolfiporia cocos MD-104 SS10]
MIDQMDQVKLPTVAVCEETLAKESSPGDMFKDIVTGKFRQVIVSPKIVKPAKFCKEVSGFYQCLCVLCIDEAHRISIWGGSFHPDYIRSLMHPMRHTDDSKADLFFLLPPAVIRCKDILITLVYCNTRTTCEDVMDWLRGRPPENFSQAERQEAIAFYHAKIGNNRKRDLERRLQDGKVRILVCTDAMGMNVARVILWGLPPSFSARDLTTLGEAILIVPARLFKTDTTQEDIIEALEISALEAPAVTAPDEDIADKDELIGEGNEHGRKQRHTTQYNNHEARYLSLFVGTTKCQRKVWDEFFGNYRKFLSLTLLNYKDLILILKGLRN